MKADVRDFAIRDLGCTACSLFGYSAVPCEKHHLNEGDQPGRKRRGEAYTVGLCKWHHTGHCHCTGARKDCASCHMRYGPSWWHHKREFIDTFGDGDALLEVQNRRIALCDSYVEAQALLADVRPEQAAQVKTVRDGLDEFVETLQARYDANGTVTGVPTGLESLDELTAGWQPGNLIVLVGETSMGKSALALQMALAAATHGLTTDKSTLYFSLEMTAGELTERAVANLADFPMAWMTHPKQAPDYAMQHVTRGSRAFNELPLMFDDRSALTLEQITSRALQLHMHKPLNAVFVDYMHIMGRPRRNDVAELGGIAAGLKNLSKTLAVPVIALHQLNRGNGGKRPTLGDIRASGEIAEAANTVIAIYRSEVANPGFQKLNGFAEVLILKQRQGRRDVRAWAKSRIGNMRFESCEAPDGYDETIREDESSGQAGGSGGVRQIRSRLGAGS